LTGKCSGLVGLAVGVHFICIPQGGSQHTLSECLVSLPLVIPRENLFRASTKDELPDDVILSGAYFGSQLVLGACWGTEELGWKGGSRM